MNLRFSVPLIGCRITLRKLFGSVVKKGPNLGSTGVYRLSVQHKDHLTYIILSFLRRKTGTYFRCTYRSMWITLENSYRESNAHLTLNRGNLSDGHRRKETLR